MQKIVKNRVLPAFLAFILLVSSVVVVPASASEFGLTPDTASAAQWDDRFLTVQTLTSAALLNTVCEALGYDLDTDPQTLMWAIFNSAIEGYGGTGQKRLIELETICNSYNKLFNVPATQGLSAFSGYAKQLGTNTIAGLLGLQGIKFELVKHPSSGLWRIKETGVTGYWVTTSSGLYPYAEASIGGSSSGGDQWIGETTAQDRLQGGECNLVSLDVLNLVCTRLKESGANIELKTIVGASGAQYKGIWNPNRQFLADPEGRPYVAAATSSDWAVNQDRPDTQVKDENGNPATDEDGNVIENTDNSTNIDLSNMTITLPDGKVMIADQIIYDESTKTYHIDSHDTYNYTYNYYYTWNYYINYTSITYIGQTEEYNKYYEVYYELPDGRDSADLTAEELEQLNLSIDVIPYARSADDVSIRSLYHFDGDTKDSSYWNYCTEFYWHTGASLTYMDAGTFEGALYLDETEHVFELLLPSAITSGDFTMQFRYYQSATAAPVTDSYVQLSGTDVLKFDGASLKNGSGAALASMPVGSWNEIAISRYNGSIRYYLNGVYLSSTSNTTAFGDTILFHFGDDQQTFKYFDEFRFVSKSLYGAYNYTPSSVPFDTNLTLVLPDSQIPVADEYWSITASSDNLLNGNFTNGTLPGGFTTLTSSTNTYSVIPPALGIRTTYSSISCSSTCATLTRLSNSTTYSTSTAEYWVGGMFSCIGRCNNSYTYLSGLENGTYTLSVILGDGTVSSYTFTLKYGSSSGVKSGSQTFDWGTLGVERCSIGSTSSAIYAYILPNSGTSIDVVYVELLKASSTDLSAEWVESVTVFDKDSLNTPTLAVRTDLDITSYQIGGVRPSLPSKGQVWALVEGQYITSLQIYTGSAWEGVDGRIWTGERWIPYSSYNIVTLKDMYDIVDGSGSNYEYIYTESGFWSWWQKSWNAFTEKLFSALGTGGSSSGTTGSAETESLWSKLKDAVTTGIADLIEGLFTLLTEVLQKLIGAATDLLTGIFSFLTDTVLGGVTDFFTSLTDGSLLDGFQQSTTDAEGNVTVTTGLPEGVSAVFAFFSGLFLLMPPELRYAAFFGIGLMLFLAVLKLVKE